jgi:hypothetical protein
VTDKLIVLSHAAYRDGGSKDLDTNRGWFHINRRIASRGTSEYERVTDSRGPVSDELAIEVLVAEEEEYFQALKEKRMAEHGMGALRLIDGGKA